MALLIFCFRKFVVIFVNRDETILSRTAEILINAN